jgi:hypothetical protein
VCALSESSSSDLVDEAVDDAVLGWMSGALYDSIFVVWMSSTGAEILLRIELNALVVLLRCGIPSASAAAEMLCLFRRVVKALVIVDILTFCSRRAMVFAQKASRFTKRLRQEMFL